MTQLQSQPFRTATGGRIDRHAPLDFEFDGHRFTGSRGDTLASALLANGVHQVATSILYGRPRGVMGAGLEDATALVQVDHPYSEPMVPATTVTLTAGMAAHGLPGQGRLDGAPDRARYDCKHAHADVLVVGAGAAGLTAALTAARSGARVILLDEQSEPGGALLGSNEWIDSEPADCWIARVTAELASYPDVLMLARTTVFGVYDDGAVRAVQRRTDQFDDMPLHAARHRIWRIRARQIILATGAHERPVAFPDNDRPGILLAGAARTYLHRYAVLVGRRIVVFTTNDSAYAAAADLVDAGAQVVALVDSRPQAPTAAADRCRQRGIEIRVGSVVRGTDGDERVTAAHIGSLDGAGPADVLECDALLVSGGWNPAVHLYSQARGTLRYSTEWGAFLPAGPLPAVRVTGTAAGDVDFAACVTGAQGAALAALSALGLAGRPAGLPRSTAPRTELRPAVLWSVPLRDDGPAGDVAGVPARVQPAPPSARVPTDTRFVDLQRDATVADVLRATGAGLRSVEHVKRYTTIGTAHDQGRTSGVLASGIVADALGVDIAELGTTTFRPPYAPVSFAALAGRDRGELFDPIRTTPLHRWHVEHGARFEDVGQWKRPWFYPLAGEDMSAAVRRECRAARTGVGIMDGSTLGKIDVRGPDAGWFLDMLYTNLISSLQIGFIRYGVMCGPDGMVLDDGTVLRAADDRFLVTTTTGNAAKILDWMQEWLQTEWPHLQVTATSVTEHWVTIPVVGPRSRDVLAAVTELDVSNEGFGFMTWRDAHIAGIPARICRISFSGELAYEVNVRAWEGLSVWTALVAAGAPFGITPYGTETMHVLRAEKGFPIIGQETDGTVTPQDLGMSWAVSRKKTDFLGKRSFLRAENQRTDRKQLVGLLPDDPTVVLPEGAQIVDTPAIAEPPTAPVPMLGHITSSYHSETLGRGFALALVRSGRERIGQHLNAYNGSQLVPVTVTDSVLYDREGTRRDG